MEKVKRIWRVILPTVALLLAGSLQIAANSTEGIVILHTTDIHDHLRPGYGGTGGLPYISGYVRSVREKENNLLVLDAGDVTEKGDMVAFNAGGEITYRAMSRIGYDAVAIGNHDNDAGIEALRRYEEELGQELLCLNRIDANGIGIFPGSRIVTVGSTRVGIIGMIVPQDSGTLDQIESGRALDRESRRLADQADLIVALCHESVEECSKWSLAAPEVDLFVTGHSHKPIPEPIQVEETGAWLVQSGYYALSVGYLEVKVDLQQNEIVGIDGHLVPMIHETFPPDQEMLDWVLELEAKYSPEAANHLFFNNEHLTGSQLAWLGAESMRKWSGAEIAFCQKDQVIRSLLPLGPVDVNAVFLTGGYRAHLNYQFGMTGREIAAYLKALADDGRSPTMWSGFTARLIPIGVEDFAIRSDLDPDRKYRVVMPEVEYRTRLMRMARKHRERSVDSPLVHMDKEPTSADVTYVEAMSWYLGRLADNGWSLQEAANQIQAGLGPEE